MPRNNNESSQNSPPRAITEAQATAICEKVQAMLESQTGKTVMAMVLDLEANPQRVNVVFTDNSRTSVPLHITESQGPNFG